DRFKLKLHRQNREMRMFALVVDKSGPKFHESKGEGQSQMRASSKLSRQWTFSTIAQFAASLADAMEAPVQDQTGLTAKYDLTLDLTPFVPAEGRPDIASMMVTAIREQLGLKLESHKAPAEVLIVEHAEKPTAN